jgi:hypothetical protein
MKPETPAKGILEQDSWGTSKRYFVPCDCSDRNHAHDIFVESDVDFVTVTIYTKSTSRFWEKNRFKQIWDLLTKGYVEMETETFLKEKQALNYAHALKKASKDVLHLRKKKSHGLKKASKDVLHLSKEK